MLPFWDCLLLFAVLAGRGSATPHADLADADAVEQAVADFQAGREREQSFRRLVDATYPTIRSFLGKRVFSPDEALELTQETFLSIYTGLDGFRREASFRTWAFRIAHVTYLKWLKRQKRQSQEVVADPQASWGAEDGRPVAVNDETPLVEALRKETSTRLSAAVEELTAAIAELPEQEGRCVLLRVYHDLKYREIADFLGLQEGTVKAHLHHARLKLRTRLAGCVEGIDF